MPETGDPPASETGDPVARETGDLATPDPGDPDASQDQRGCEVARPDQRDRAPALGPDSTRERQMGARSTVRPGTPTPHPARPLWVVDAEIAFTAPRSVAALLHEAIAAFTRQREQRWWALTRLLGHVIHEWEAQPGHRDPIFARDGWRCAVPACAGRRNLHDHHVHFRSRGGDNQQTNRVTVCAWHHLRGIHAGRVRATGTAPDALEWALGVDREGRAWRRFRGDRYLR